jgi:CHAT domain-containing protein
MRKLEDHLGPEELASLPDSLVAESSDGKYKDLMLHLAQCQACAELVALHGQLRALRARESAAQSSCPDQATWLEYAEGLLPDQAVSLLAHAAQCSRCAELLREAMTLMQPVQSEVLPEGLQSIQPAWQKHMSAQMMEQAGKQVVPQRTGFFSRFSFRSSWVMVPAAAMVLVALALGGIAVWRMANPSESHLLAQAYNQHRMIPLRIPEGDPVPMASGTRGSPEATAEPSALLELKLRAAKHLEKDENDAYWNQVLGQVNILENKSGEALDHLTKAKKANSSLPDLQADMAAALFLKAEQTGQTADYLAAGEAYDEALLKPGPNASVLHYNLALFWEHQNRPDKAQDELRAALASEKSAAWRSAIQAEIDRLASHPSAFIPNNDSSSSFTATAISHESPAHYEDDLEHGTEQLLSKWSSDPTAQADLSRIAETGLQHQDRWLTDWIAAAPTHRSEDGDRALATAVHDGAAGQAQASLAASRQAASGYQNAGNIPGQLRATLAEIYALQRLDHAKECLELATKLLQAPTIRRYAWIYTQLTLEEASCHFLEGDYAQAQAAYDRASLASIEYRLDWLHLRALAGETEILQLRGNPIEALESAAGALAYCHKSHCPPIREYPFVLTMARCAETLGFNHIAVDLMRTGEKLASASGDATTHAYALEYLALLEGRAGLFDESESTFIAGWGTATSGNPIASVEIYRAEWETDRAEILSRRGTPSAALTLLQKDQEALLASKYQHGRTLLFTQEANALLMLNELDPALSNATSAVREAEKSLVTLHSTFAKELWQRESAPAYAQLVNVYLRRNQSDDAFQAWERFSVLPYETLPRARDNLSVLHDAARQISNSTYHPRVLVLALVGDTYIGWLVPDQPTHVMRTATLGDRVTIQQLVTAFYHLCADPDSNLAELHVIGARLYGILFQPFADAEASGPLWIAPDPSLMSLPFSALTSPNGSWLGATHTINLLPAWWVLHPDGLLEDSPHRTTERIVIVNGFAKNQAIYSETFDLAQLFPHATILEQNGATVQAVQRNLQTAEIFHFSGHAMSQSGTTRLILSASGEQSPALGAESVMHLHLQQCRIAVLAACNTAASAPERVPYSPDLRNAMLQAGVHAVIASNWDVDDHATGVLMKAFYGQLIRGISAAQSLQLAEKSMQADSKWQHPYYWASFQLFSN